MASNLELKIKAIVDGLGELSKLKTALDGAVTSVTGLGQASKSADVSALSKSSKDAADAVGSLSTAAAGIEKTLGGLKDAASDGAGALNEWAGAVQGIGQAADDGGGSLDDWLESMSGVSEAAVDGKSALEDWASAVGDAGDSASDGNDAVAAWTTAIGDAGNAAKDATDNMLGVGKAAGDVSDSLGDMGKAAKDGATGIESVGNSGTTNETKLSKLTAGLKSIVAGFFSVSKETSPTVNAFSKAGTAASELKGKLDDAAKGTDGFKKGLGEGLKSLGEFTANANPATGAAGAFLTAVKPLAGALAAIAGIKITFDWLKDAADYAAKVETLGITLNTVGRNAGYTKGELSGFEKVLKDTGISTEAARDSMIQMMNAGLALGVQAGKTEPQVQLLARAAQDLAVATGENSSESMQRLITNIQQMDTVGFRFMGLSVDITKAQEGFAKSINTTAGALTDAQKRQAVLNEVLQQSAKLSGVYEESMESVGKKLGSMKRYVDELRLALGDKLLPIYGAVVDAGTKLLKDLNKQAEGFDTNKKAANDYGAGVKAVMEPLGALFSKVFGVLLKLFEGLAPHFRSVLEAVGGVIEVFTDLFGALTDDGTSAMELFKDVLKGLELPFAGLADGAKVLKAAIFGIISVLAEFNSKVIGGIADLLSYIPGLNIFSNGLQSIADKFGSISDESEKKMDKAVESLMKGDSATKRWLDSLTEAQAGVKNLDATPFKQAEEEIRKLTRAQADNTLTSAQQIEAYDKLQQGLNDAKDAGIITEKEFGKLSAKLGEVHKRVKDELDDSLKQLKTTSGELATNVSIDAGTVVGALGKIAQNGLATAEVFGQAFTKNVDMAKNVEELAEFTVALEKAKERWPEAPEALAEAQQVVADRFTEIYTKQLEGLKTTKDWELLRDSVIKLGEAGVLTGDQVKTALAEGEIAVNKMSPAFKAAAEAAKGIDTAIEANTKQLDLMNKAVAETSAKAAEHFGKVGDGYRELAGMAQKTSDNVISEIQRRETRELSYIDATYKSTDKAEQDKTAAVIKSIGAQTKALDTNYNEQMKFLGLSEKADKSALEAKLLGLDKEIASVSKAMGETHTSRKDAAEKLKGLEKEKVNAIAEFEAQSKAKRIEVMTNLQERYKAFIDRLNAEEDRHLGKVKEIQGQIEQAKMSAEERIRAIQKGAMGEYEKYQADMSDINELKTKAREAANKGEYDKAKEYLSQAKGLIGDVNKEVKDGENVMVSKAQAAKNAQDKTKELLQEELNLFAKQKEGHKAAADSAGESAKQMGVKADELKGKIDEVQKQAEKETKLNIQFNGEEAINKLSTLKELLDKKDNLLNVDLDLKGAKEQLDQIMLKIAKGEKIPADMDTSKAEAALKAVQAQAEKSGDIKLVMDTQKALDAIGKVKSEANKPADMKVNADTKSASSAIQGLSKEANGTGKFIVSAQVTGDGEVRAVISELKSASKQDYNAKVVYGAKKDPTWDQVKTEVIKIKDEFGKTTYTDITVKGDFVQKATEILALNTKLGTIKPVDTTVTIQTNSKEAAEKIAEAMKKRPDVQSTHNVDTDAAKKVREIDNALQTKTVNSTHNVDTDAAKKVREIDTALEKKDVTSTHNVDTDAAKKIREIDNALETKDVKSTHDIDSNAADKKPEIDSAMESQTATSTHDVETNASDVVPEIEAALESQTTESTHDITTNADDAGGEIEGLDGLDTSSQHEVEADTDTAEGDIEALDGLDTSSEHTVDTDAPDAEGEIEDLDGLDTSSSHEVTTNADAASGEIDNLDGYDTSSEHVVEAEDSVNEASGAIDELDGYDTESEHTVDAEDSVTEASGVIDELDGYDTESTHNVDAETSVGEAESAISELDTEDTDSAHDISDNSSEASGNIQSLNGQDTNSTHQIYVEKVYVNEGGGLAGMFFGRIPVGEVKVGESKSDPRYADGGPVVAQRFAVGGYVYPQYYAAGGGVRRADSGPIEFEIGGSAISSSSGSRDEEERKRREQEAARRKASQQSSSGGSNSNAIGSSSYAEGGPVGFAFGGKANADDLRKAESGKTKAIVDEQKRVAEEARRKAEEARRKREAEEAARKAEEEKRRANAIRTANANAAAANRQGGSNSISSRTYEDGGPVEFAVGGKVHPRRGDGQRKPTYPKMTGGIIPGAGNEDTQHRMLDAGSFVLRKSVVNKYGAQSILNLLNKAKSMPKRETQAPGRVQAVLMPGEIVVDRDTTSRIGSGFLSHMNNPSADVSSALKFADGGFVHNFSPVINAPVDLSTIGQAFANGGPVANPVASSTVQVDLRSNKGKASVTVEQNQSQNLLSLLADIQGRS